jgi:Phosphotransferase enzyme family
MLAEAAPVIPDAERAAFDALRAEVAALDAAEGLPEGLIHPDFVLANVVATPGGMVLVDWAGAGRGPRLWSLAFLLYAEAAKDPRRAGAVLLGYRERVTLEPEELDRLGSGRPDPPPHSPRLVGVHGTDHADAGHDSRVADQGPDRDDRDPGPRGGDGPLISRSCHTWP